jgi:uncharacterized OB-fold protein
MQALSIILTIISFALIIVMLITFRRVRSISTRAPLISIAFSILVIVLYGFIIGASIPMIVLLAIGVAGLLLGLWQGKNTKVWMEKGKGKAQNTFWFLVIWAICYGVNQTLVVTGQQLSMNLGIGAMTLGTGVTVGSQGTLLFKLLRLPPELSTRCPNCGKDVKPGRKFCEQCGKELVIVTPPVTQKALVQCPQCGHTNNATLKFCVQCGKTLVPSQTMSVDSVVMTGKCPVCGHMNPVKLNFCTQCGHKFR